MSVTINGSTGITTPDVTSDGLTVDTTTLVVDETNNRVGIGTGSPGSILELKAATPVLQINGTTAASARGIAFQDNGVTRGSLTHNADSGATTLSSGDAGNGYFITFKTDATERMRIDSSGNLLVGTTSATVGTSSGTFVVNFAGNATNGIKIRDSYSSAATNNAVVFIRNASEVGSITTTLSATAYNTSSDYRLKENVAPMTGALATVAALKPCTYTWKATGESGQGFIAHELQAVMPDCVTGEKDAVETYTDEEGVEQTRPVYQGVDTSFLVATLTAAIQELKAINDTQAQTIESLTARIEALEASNV